MARVKIHIFAAIVSHTRTPTDIKQFPFTPNVTHHIIYTCISASHGPLPSINLIAHPQTSISIPHHNMNQNPLTLTLARKRNQTLDTRLNQPYSESIPAAKMRDRNHRSSIPIQPSPQYHPQFETVPTDGSYPASRQNLFTAAHTHLPSNKPYICQTHTTFKARDLTQLNPLPNPPTITHTILISKALTQFHLAVYLADADAGQDEVQRRDSLKGICNRHMPVMTELGVRKDQIVFFYHGRSEIGMGNAVWDAISEWERGKGNG